MQYLNEFIELLRSVNIRSEANRVLNRPRHIRALLNQEGPEAFLFDDLIDFRQPVGSGKLDLANGVRLATAISSTSGLRFDIVGLSDPEIERNFRKISDAIFTAAKNAHSELLGQPPVDQKDFFLQRMEALGVSAPNDDLLNVFMDFGLSPIHDALELAEGKRAFTLKDSAPTGVLIWSGRLHIKLLPGEFPDPVRQLTEIENCFIRFFKSK